MGRATRGAHNGRAFAVAAAVVLFLAGVLWAVPAQAQEADDAFVPGEVVVKLLLAPNGATNCAATIESIRAGESATVKDRLVENPRVACIYLLQLPRGADTEAAAGRIAADSARVAYAEPNFVTEAPEGNPRWKAWTDSEPTPSNATSYSSQYAVGKMKLTEAQGVSNGGGAVVAVLDTGVQPDHPELQSSLLPGYDFVGDPANNVSDDPNPADEPNGRDDDNDGLTDEMVGHGTHVAGIVHLAAPQAKILPLRVLDSDGRGNSFEIAEAAQYAVRQGVDVVNLSLGSSQESELLGDVTDDLAREDDDDDDGPDALEGVPPEGVVVVASAGNENTQDLRYPAAEEGVISVASVGEDEARSGFSNFGPWIDVAAPGDDIVSAFPTDEYREWDGTSMSAPFVAGQAALIRARDCDLPASGMQQGSQSVESQIRTAARALNDPNLPSAGHADALAGLQNLQPKTGCATAPPPGGSGGTPPPNTAPTVSALQPTGAIRDRTPRISATVRDRQTNLSKSNIRLFVDGRPRAFSYNASTDRLVHASRRMSPGRHTVRVVVRDPQGLAANRAWSFRIRR